MRRYGIRWIATWPHVSLGISAHLWPPEFAHLSFHTPIGVVVVGHIGLDGSPPDQTVTIRVQVDDRATPTIRKLQGEIDRTSRDARGRYGTET